MEDLKLNILAPITMTNLQIEQAGIIDPTNDSLIVSKDHLYDALVAVGTTLTTESVAYMLAKKVYVNDPAHKYLEFARRWYSEAIV
jgi:hypothetical protein